MSIAKAPLCVLAFAGVVAVGGIARATPDFPPFVDQYLMLGDGGTLEEKVDPPDGCRLCHVNGSQGGLPLTNFGTLMQENGAMPYEAASTGGPALAAIRALDPNALADIEKGIDPNADPSAFADAPKLGYGCASVAPGTPEGEPLLLVLAGLGLLIARRRRRSANPAGVSARPGEVGPLPRAVLLAAIALGGCSDVGDSTAIPDFGGGDQTGDSSVEENDSTASRNGDVSAPPESGVRAAADAQVKNSSEEFDAASDTSTSETPGAGSDSATGIEASTAGAGTVDSGSDAATGEEASVPRDAGPDSGAGGEAAGGAGSPDATIGGSDAGQSDAGAPDAEAAEAQASDAGARDASSDAAGGPTPCTAAPCAPSGEDSVECTGNTTGVCTATEAPFVAFDVEAGHLAQGQLDPDTSCYECMEMIGCLDDDQFGDTGHECGDVTTAAIDGEPALQSCLDNVVCMLTTVPSCANADPPSQCFCGTNNGAACLTAGAADGPCLTQEINGLPGVAGAACSGAATLPDGGVGEPASCTEGNATTTQEQFTNTALPAGQANTLLGCAYANCAMQCGL